MDRININTAKKNLSTNDWTPVITVCPIGYRDGFSVWIRDHQAEPPASVVTGIMLVEQYRDEPKQYFYDEDIILLDIYMELGLNIVIGSPSSDDFGLDIHSDFLRDPDVNIWDLAEMRRSDFYHKLSVHTIYPQEVLDWLITTHHTNADAYRWDMRNIDLDKSINILDLLSAVVTNTSIYRAAYRVDSYLPHPTLRRIAWYVASKYKNTTTPYRSLVD